MRTLATERILTEMAELDAGDCLHTDGSRPDECPRCLARRALREYREATRSWDNWMEQWLELAGDVGIETPPEVMRHKVREEMLEWMDDESPKEAIDVLACLVLWAKKVNFPPDQLLNLAYERLEVWRQRTWERQPDGTYHHVKGDPAHA